MMMGSLNKCIIMSNRVYTKYDTTHNSINVFGFSTRQHFEELFMSLLVLFNSDTDANIIGMEWEREWIACIFGGHILMTSISHAPNTTPRRNGTVPNPTRLPQHHSRAAAHVQNVSAHRRPDAALRAHSPLGRAARQLNRVKCLRK